MKRMLTQGRCLPSDAHTMHRKLVCGTLGSTEWMVNGDAVRPMLCMIKNEGDTTSHNSMQTCGVSQQAIQVNAERQDDASMALHSNVIWQRNCVVRLTTSQGIFYNMCNKEIEMCPSTVTAMHTSNQHELS